MHESKKRVETIQAFNKHSRIFLGPTLWKAQIPEGLYGKEHIVL